MNTVSWLQGAGLPASRTQLLARAPQLAVWVLAAALGVQAAIIVTQLAGSGTGARPVRGAVVAATAQRPQVDLLALSNAHLFGAAPAPAPADDASAPATSMPLVLTGTIATADPRIGMAIIGTTPANARTYPVGERVPGNARVHAVYTDRVLLDRGGVIEALLLPHKSGGSGAPAPIQNAGAAAIDRVQRALSNEPGLISDVLRPQPVFAEGKLRGYRVYPGKNAKVFAQLGLRNGDLVLAVNGSTLDDPNRGNEIFSSLGNSDQARITVMRNGQQQDITLNLTQIANQAEQLSQGNSDQNSTAPPASDAGTPPARPGSKDQ